MEKKSTPKLDLEAKVEISPLDNEALIKTAPNLQGLAGHEKIILLNTHIDQLKKREASLLQSVKEKDLEKEMLLEVMDQDKLFIDSYRKMADPSQEELREKIAEAKVDIEKIKRKINEWKQSKNKMLFEDFIKSVSEELELNKRILKKYQKLETGEDKTSPIMLFLPKTEGEGGHHGGTWEVAYADFVTALMILFFMMWVMAMASQGAKDDLREYFKNYKLFKHSGPSRQTGIGTKDQRGVGEKKAYNAEMIGGLEDDLKKDLAMSKHEIKGGMNVARHPLGLGIQIMDIDKLNPMFKVGESEFTPRALDQMRWLAERLKFWPYKIIIEGHTDGTPFAGEENSNISLSTLRALEARNVLGRFGVTKERFFQVVGYAHHKPLIRENTFDARNRRITIIIMFDKAKFPDMEEVLSKTVGEKVGTAR